MSSDLTEINRAVRDVQSRMSAVDHKLSRLTAELPRRGRMPADDFVRAVTVSLLAHFQREQRGQFPLERLEFARALYGDNLPTTLVRALDRPGRAFTRAAHLPAQVAVPGWAGELAGTENYPGPLASLAPASTYAALAGRGGPRAILSGNLTVKFPQRVVPPSLAGAWYTEGQPIKVVEASFSGAVSLGQNKVAVISTFSRELAKRSVPEIEATLRQALAEDTTLIVDSALIDTTAASSSRPAGLLNGITPITATAITGGPLAALAGDLGALANAIGNPTDLVFLMNAGERTRALALSPGLAGATIIQAPLPAKQIAALDGADFASVEGDEPALELSQHAVLHMDDAPSAIGVVGSPNVVSAPVRSTFQTDVTALRLIQVLGWVMRRPNRVATIASVTW